MVALLSDDVEELFGNWWYMAAIFFSSNPNNVAAQDDLMKWDICKFGRVLGSVKRNHGLKKNTVVIPALCFYTDFEAQ